MASLTTDGVTSVVKRTEWISRPVSPTCIPELSQFSWALRGATDSMISIMARKSKCSDYFSSSAGSSSIEKSVMPALTRMLYHEMSLRMSDG